MANKDGDNQITRLRSGVVPAVAGHRPAICTFHLYTDGCSLKILRSQRHWGAPLGTHSYLKNEWRNGMRNEYVNG